MVIERAKVLVAALQVEDANVVRFMGLGSFAFGCMVEATKEGYLAFERAVTELGLRAEMHRSILVQPSKLEPVYLYEVEIYIPENWQG